MIQLTYTGPEATELLRTIFPNEYESSLELVTTNLKRIMTNKKCTPEAAFKLMMDFNLKPATKLYVLAAAYQLIISDMDNNDSIISQVKTLEHEQQRIATQLFNLERNHSIEPKGDLRGIYIQRQQDITERIKQLCKSLDVINPQHVQAQSYCG